MAEACWVFGVPVVGGNVSFYNETRGISIYPTPIVGVVGKAPAAHVITQAFREAGRTVILLGETKDELGGSEYLAAIHHREQGLPPELILEAELALYRCLLELTGAGLVESAHDCSEGGVAVALAECCVSSEKPIGMRAVLHNPHGLRRDAVLFSESQSRVVISTRPRDVESVLTAAGRWGVPAATIGETGGGRLSIDIDGEVVVDVALAAVRSAWSDGLTRELERSPCASN
jgi:phosphoribosylformylglycinamidine synthase